MNSLRNRKMSRVVKAVCFGEVLIDVFSDEERIGGAPLNVAVRLSSLGVETGIISSIGFDQKGEQIIEFLKDQGVEIRNISKDSDLPTGVVNVNLSKSGSATFEIAGPAAWDNIEVTREMRKAVEESDLFIFGSLVCRDERNRNSLFQLLQKAKCKVLDLNLRPPHYSKELLLELLKKADFLKFNDDELFEISEYLGSSFHSLEQNLIYIAENSPAKTICVTKGRHGAVLWREGKLFYNSGFKVEVKDTVGAGDSFLAALLAKLFQGEHPQTALDYACAIGALVAGEKGANPKLDPDKVKEFIYGPG